MAAVACLYTWEQYQDLPGNDIWVGDTGSNSQASVIATYRALMDIKREMGSGT